MKTKRGYGWAPFAVGLALMLPATAQAQEWTRLRGPNGTGVSMATTIPVQCTEADYNWKIQLPGVGHSSPVIWGTKLFVTSAEDAAGKRHVHCLDTASGRSLWTKTYPFSTYNLHKFNTSASSTPAVDADHVYVIWPAPTSVMIYALDHAGKEIWKRDLGPFVTQHGGASSPIVVGDTVILTKEPDEGEGMLVGLDRKTGEIRWKRDRVSKNASYATPFVYEPKGGAPEVIFTSTAHGITSLDPKTGELNWEMRDVFRARCVGSPVLLSSGLVFATAGAGNGDKQAVAVRPGSKKAGIEPKVAFQPTRGVSYVPSPVAVGDRVFVWGDAGLVTCLKADSGEQVWSERVDSSFFGSPVCVNNKLYAMSTKGELIVVEAGDQFKLLGRSPLGETSHSTPAVSGGVMYLRTERHLISLGGKKGKG